MRAAAMKPQTPSTVQQAAPAMSGFQHKWRLELFFKSQDELQSQLPFLQRHGVKRVNITNKSNDDQLLDTAQILQAAIPGVDICLHYSLKYNSCRIPAATLEKLQSFCGQLKQQLTKATSAETGPASAACAAAPAPCRCHVLLVTGGGKRKAFDTRAALQELQARQKELPQRQQQQQQQCHQNARSVQPAIKRQRVTSATEDVAVAVETTTTAVAIGGSSSSDWPSLAVAFNPYLPGQQEAQAERERLRLKLETGLVDRIYLQMGTDLERLESGLALLGSLVEELYSANGRQRPQLLGSVFVPSKKLLAQMRFRPWNGVFLSEEYLSSVQAADAITRRLLKVYAAAGVVPLVESAVKKDEDMAYVRELLHLDDGGA